jgi:hypothetical protein
VQSSLLTDFQVCGESGLGKTTFINTLFSTTIKNYADHKRRHNKQVDKTVEIEITKAELEERFFKGEQPLKLNIERAIFNQACYSPSHGHRHTGFRRLCQQPRFMAADHRILG